MLQEITVLEATRLLLVCLGPADHVAQVFLLCVCVCVRVYVCVCARVCMCVTAELSVLQFWFALKNAPWGLVQGCRLIIRKRTVARSSWLWRRKGGMYNIGMAYRRPARCVDKILPKQCTHISSPPPLLCSAVHVIALRVRVRVSLSLSLSLHLSL